MKGMKTGFSDTARGPTIEMVHAGIDRSDGEVVTANGESEAVGLFDPGLCATEG